MGLNESFKVCIKNQCTNFNPSFTKPFGTHTFYEGESARTPGISEIIAPMNVKLCRVSETPLNVLEMLKLLT